MLLAKLAYSLAGLKMIRLQSLFKRYSRPTNTFCGWATDKQNLIFVQGVLTPSHEFSCWAKNYAENSNVVALWLAQRAQVGARPGTNKITLKWFRHARPTIKFLVDHKGDREKT